MQIGKIRLPRIIIDDPTLIAETVFAANPFTTRLHRMFRRLVEETSQGREIQARLQSDRRVNSLSEKSVAHRGGASRFDTRTLAQWWLWHANEVGQTRADQDLDRYLDGDDVEILGATWVFKAAQALIDTAVEHFGGVHILVNNAAMRRNTSLADTSFEDWKTVVSTNLDVPFLCTRAAIPHMMAAGWGRIVMLGGVSAHRGVKNRVHVATTKAGLTGMTRALAAEFAEAGITANCVAPGSINTIRGAAAGTAPHGGHPNLLGREGEPDEVAHVIVSLCRPEAAYTTGQTIHVNGGAYLA